MTKFLRLALIATFWIYNRYLNYSFVIILFTTRNFNLSHINTNSFRNHLRFYIFFENANYNNNSNNNNRSLNTDLFSVIKILTPTDNCENKTL